MRSILVALLALALCGCGGDGRTLLVVHVVGDRSGVDRVLADAAVGGIVSMDVQTFDSDVQDFGLLLPAGATGTVVVLVNGYASGTRPLRCGSASMVINGQPQVDVTVTLTAAGCP